MVNFPGGAVWEFAFETYEAAQDRLPGPVYRIVKGSTRDGHDTTIAYDTSSVTVTDASGHAYVCSLDAQDRITQISVAGRSWSYAYAGSTVTETNNQTGKTIATTLDAEQRLTAVVVQGTDGTEKSEYRTYDSDGLLTSRTINGVTTTVTEARDGDETTYAFSTGTPGANGSVSRVIKRSRLGVLRAENGVGQAAVFTRNRMFVSARRSGYRDSGIVAPS